MSGSVDTADILVIVEKGDQFNVSLQPPDQYGISINSGDTYVVSIDLPTSIVSNTTDTYFRVADFANFAATASFFGGVSASVDWPNITNKPLGLVSSSEQINYTNISNIPSGILSSSAQINQLPNVSASFATTSSYALNAGSGVGFPFSGSAVITGSLLVSGGNIAGTLFGTASLTQAIIGGKSRYVPLWTGSSANELTSSIMYQTSKGIFIGYDTEPHFHSVEGETLAVHSGDTGVKNVIYAHGAIDSDYRINLRNISSGPSASTNFKATADIGDDIGGFVEMGINSSTYTRTDQIGGPLDAYLFSTGSDLLIGTLSPDKRIILFTGPGDAESNARVYIDASGSVAINTATQTTSGNPEALLVTALADSYNLISGQANINNYSQLNIINANGGSSASADIVATANNGTETTNYIDMGINSDQFGLLNGVGGPNDAYLYSTGRMLHIGNTTPGQHIMFFVGGFDSEANSKLILESNNQHVLSGSLNVTGSLNVLEGVINNLTASFAMTASYVSGAIGTWEDLLNKPANLVSSSQQVKNFLPPGTVSSSQQATSWTVLSASFASTASSITFTPATASFATSASFAPTNPGVVSSSTQINYTQLQNIPAGIVSSSTQINTGSFTGTFIGTSSWANNSISASFALTASYVSGAASTWDTILNKPSGLVSSSAQINTGSFSGSFIGSFVGTSSWSNNAISSSFAITASAATSITFVPASASYAPTNPGVVSSSTQIDYTQIQNKPTIIATASYIEYNNVVNKPTLISSSTQVNYTQLQNIPVGIVSSSSQINTGSFTGTFIGTSSWARNASTASTILGGTDKYIPLWIGEIGLTSSLLYQTGSSILLGATEQHTPEAPDRFGVFAGVTDSYNLISAHGEIDSYLQLNVKNFSSQSNASSDIVATADVGTEEGGYISMGINSSTYNVPNSIGNPLDAYLYTTGSDLLIGNIANGKKIILFNGEGTALNNARVYIDSLGTVSINTGSATPGNPEALLVKAIAFSYNMITAQADINNYAQVNIINKNSGNFASSDFVATANNGNEEQYYIAMGINSENFTGDVGYANDAYLYTTGSNLLVGNIAPDKKLILFAGDTDTNSSTKFIIDPDNQHQITGSLTITGSITVNADVVNALTASNAVSSSHAISASYAPLILPPNIVSSSTQINTGSFSGSFAGTLIGTGSWANNAISSSFATTASAATSLTFVPSTASFATSASFAPTNAGVVSSSTQIDYTQIQNRPTTIATASFVEYVNVANKPSLVSASSQIQLNAITGATFSNASFLFPQNLRVEGTLTAQELRTEFVTSSVIFESGSTKFGDSSDDTHQFTGSLSVLGTISGSLILPNGIVSSSGQVAALLPVGTVSSSAQINTGSFTGSFTGLFRGDGSQLTGVVASGVGVSIADDGTVQGNASQLDFGNFITATVSSNTASIAVTLPAGTVSSSLQINTGSFSGSFTGNFIGTSSWASNSISSSFATTASAATSITFVPSTASFATSASYAPTILPNGIVSSSSQINTGSFSGSFVGNLFGTATNAITASYALNGTGGGSTAVTIDTYTFDADGTTVNYVVSQSYNSSSLFVTVNGLGYTNITDYTVSSNTITFVSPPVSASYVVIRALTNVTSGATGSFYGSFFGNIESASYATTTSFAVSASWAPGGAGTNNWNDLINIPSGLVSSSTQATTWTVATASFVEFTNVANRPTLISSSTQVNYAQLQNIPAGIVSSSEQINTGSFSGSFRGVFVGDGSQLTGVVASGVGLTVADDGSVQGNAGRLDFGNFITATVASSTASINVVLPNGVVSSSSQINTGSFSGSFRGILDGTSSFATTALTSSYFSGSVRIIGLAEFPAGIKVEGPSSITGSLTFASGGVTGSIFGTSSWANNVISSSNAITSSFALSASWAPGGAGSVTSLTAGNGLTGGTITSTGTITVDTGSIHFLDGVKKELNTEGVISSSIQINTGSFSGSFTGNFFGTSSQASTSSFALTASYFDGFITLPLGLDVSGSLIVTGSQTITGSLNVTSGITGSLLGTSSNATSASFALSASWAPGGPGGGVTSITAGDGLTGGNITSTGTITVDTGSIHFLDGIKKELNTEGVISSSIQINTGSFTGSFTGILIGTSSWASNSVSSSFATTATLFNGASSTTFANTGSNVFVGNQIITGSVILSSSLPTELRVIGDTEITGSLRMLGGITGSLFGTSSWASSASVAVTALTASYFSGSLEFPSGLIVTGSVTASVGFTGSLTGVASNAVSSSFATTASAATSITFTPSSASFAISSSRAVTSSFAISASWAPTVAGTMVPIQDEGTVVVSTPVALNFIGAGVTVTNTSNTASITIPGGSGGDISAKIVSASYTFGAANEFIFTTGSFTVTLPSAVGIIGRQYQIKNISTGVIFITGSSMIDDNSDITIAEKNTALGLISNGITWSIF